MNPKDVADLTDEERMLLVVCSALRKAKTGTVRATEEQLAQRLGWSHADLRSRLGILVDVEAVEVAANGRITMPPATAEVVASDAQLRATAGRLARSGAGARGSLQSKRLGDSGSTPPTPPFGGRGSPSLPPSSPREREISGDRTTLRRGARNWTPYDLAGHFATRATQFAVHVHVAPGVSNKKALAAQFRAWMNEGWTALQIRELIDYFAANMARYVSDGIPVWKSFLARRADIWTDLDNDQPEVFDESADTNSDWSLDSA